MKLMSLSIFQALISFGSSSSSWSSFLSHLFSRLSFPFGFSALQISFRFHPSHHVMWGGWGGGGTSWRWSFSCDDPSLFNLLPPFLLLDFFCCVYTTCVEGDEKRVRRGNRFNYKILTSWWWSFCSCVWFCTWRGGRGVKINRIFHIWIDGLLHDSLKSNEDVERSTFLFFLFFPILRLMLSHSLFFAAFINWNEGLEISLFSPLFSKGEINPHDVSLYREEYSWVEKRKSSSLLSLHSNPSDPS